jgi:nucleotide-binding universal stress UspA family protein
MADRAILEQRSESRFDDPESECKAVVESLRRFDLGHDERRKLILDAEVLPFRGEQAAEIAPLLWQFIEDYRASNVPADLVAVASAIRNYVATAPSDQAFRAAASLLNTEGGLPLRIYLELEIAKMVVRKLVAQLSAGATCDPELARSLAELANTYLNPRLLAREKHGAVALNAVLAIVLTGDPHADQIIEQARQLHVPWFQQLLGRRAARIRADLTARDSDSKLTEITRGLEQLSELDTASLVP